MKYIGRVSDLAQRTSDTVKQTKLLEEGKDNNLPMHRCEVKQIGIWKKEFENDKKERPTDIFLTLAIARAFEAFLLPEKAKPIHLKDLFLQDLDIWDKSPGLPWLEHGYKTKGDIKKNPDAVRRVRYFWHMVKMGEKMHLPDCLAYDRSHNCPVGESKIKTELEYPATMTFCEAMFAVPLMRAYQQRGPIAHGNGTAIGNMKTMLERFDGYTNFSGIDFKNFDKTVPAWLIDVAFKILLYNLDLVHYDGHGIMDSRRILRSWCHIVDYFINTTIRTASGLRFRKNVGIPSGSYFTQLVRSICCYIMVTWAYISQTGHGPQDLIVLGNDSLAGSYHRLDLKQAQKLFSQVGMTINFKKSQITTDLMTMKFLGQIGCDVPRKAHHFSKKFDEYFD